ncbi:MAG: hypothetical protein ACXWLR_06780 [Myxococcales bacterium]
MAASGIDGGNVETVSSASMEQTAQLAGFIAAHAIWSVSNGELLIIMMTAWR